MLGIFATTILATFFVRSYVSALRYGAGTYGTCQYNTCSISIATNGTVTLSTTPDISGGYAIAGDATTVTTGSGTGYSLLLSIVGAGNKRPKWRWCAAGFYVCSYPPLERFTAADCYDYRSSK